MPTVIRYIQARHKEPSGVSTLLIDNQSVSDRKGKAIALINLHQRRRPMECEFLWNMFTDTK